MDAYSLDGEKLGEVERLDDDSITIEKGWFFPKDFTIRYDDVADIREDHLIVNRGRTDLDEWRTPDYTGWSETDRENQAGRMTGRESRTEKMAGRSDTEATIPLREEELAAEKTRKEDEVVLHKVVHTEMKHMEVPVEKEELVIERVPAGQAGASDIGEASSSSAFREEETRIPIMEEEVQVSKRPVVKEEVRARKQTRTEKRDVSGEVRKEDIEVERGGKSQKK
jgi:uncharacterized protein (TIGR02271 family)